MTWVKEIIRKEAHHRNLHEKDICKCNEVHTEEERRRAREGAAERRKVKRGGSRIAAVYPHRPSTKIAPQQSADGAWSGVSYEFTPQQSGSGCWDGLSYGAMPHEQRWENGTNGYYPQADRQWENATTEYSQQPNGELRNREQQEPIHVDQGPETLRSGDFVPNVEHDLAVTLSTTEEPATGLVSDRRTVVGDQEDNGDSDQSTIVGDQTETKDRGQSTIVDQEDTNDSDQSTIVGDQVNIRLENTRGSSLSPPVAIGSVTASRQSSRNHPDVQKVSTVEDVRPALLKLTVSEAHDNVKSPS